MSKSDYVRAGPGNYTDGADTLLDAFVQKTSGSTGPPLSIFARPREAQILLANFWSAWVAAGVKVADRLFLVGSRQLGVRVPDFNVVFCPQGMSMEEQLAAFRTSEPTVVAGLTESVALLATELQRRKIDTQNEFVDEIPREPSGKRRRIYRTFDLPSV